MGESGSKLTTARRWSILSIVFFSLAFTLIEQIRWHETSRRTTAAIKKKLVVYVAALNDPLYFKNYLFFAHFGVLVSYYQGNPRIVGSAFGAWYTADYNSIFGSLKDWFLEHHSL